MKKIVLKTGLISVLCLVAAVYAMTASAHDIVGGLTNGLLSGTGSGATDTYSIVCFQDPTAASQNPTDHLFIRVSDSSTAGGPISATAVRDNHGAAVTVTDLIPADNVPGHDGYSIARTLKVTPAVQSASFTIAVHHTAAAADNYVVKAHCEDSSGVHTGTEDPQPLNNN